MTHTLAETIHHQNNKAGRDEADKDDPKGDLLRDQQVDP